jgi:hypothetical protein
MKHALAAAVMAVMACGAPAPLAFAEESGAQESGWTDPVFETGEAPPAEATRSLANAARDVIMPYRVPCNLDSGQCQGTNQIVEEIEPWAEFRRGKDKIPGLFTFYRDGQTGELFMELGPEHFGSEFIYFSYVHDGSRRDGMRTAGILSDNAVISVRRRYRHVDFIYENTSYSYDEDSAVSRAAGANVTSPVLVSLEVAATDGERVIVKANDLFLTAALTRLGQQTAMGRALGVAPGTLNARKTHVREIRNYETNSEVVSEFTFDWNNARTPFALSDTVVVQHTFLPMPEEDGFTPRLSDPRVGFFTARRTNLTRVAGNPADDLIHRWRLEKADRNARVSEPVRPITFWIEKTTPHEYRDIIANAVLAWNPVFEAAGFRDAIRVEVQPDDAEWDAGDVRYNTIRWIASPNPSFNGYGPRFTNPRTGEILGANIMLEHASVQRWIRTDRIFPEADGDIVSAAMSTDADGFDATGHDHSMSFAGHLPGPACEAGPNMALGQAFARIAATLASADPATERVVSETIVREGLAYLVLHEVGHTLGLTHNMMSTYFSGLDLINGEGARDEQRLAASVMGYPGVNVSPDRDAQGRYFPDEPGPYDRWAIAFAYDPDLDDERARRVHLARSSDPAHVFANDADDMRQPGRGIDPRANLYSLSSDPIGWSVQQAALTDATLGGLAARLPAHTGSWEEYRQSFDVLMAMRLQAANVISRFVGGVYTDHGHGNGEARHAAPFTPVPAAEQRRAIEALGEHIFGPNAFAFPPELIAHLRTERRGFDALSRADEPLVHARVRRIQTEALNHLLHPRVLNRLTDAQAYGGDYSPRAMLADLTDEIFTGDDGAPSTYRRNLQILYVERLRAAKGNSGLERVPAAAIQSTLNRIDRMNHGLDWWMDAETRDHRRYVRELARG